MSSQPVAAQDRIVLIEYLRGLASLSVAWFHLTNSYSHDWVRLSGSLGWLGVEVFFVISGFVIPLSISSSYREYTYRHFPRFMAKRILRLEPPYIASILLVLVLWQLSSMAPGFKGVSPDWTLEQLLSHFLYAIPLTGHKWLQPVYWSLAWEFAFYMTMGLLFPLIGGRADHFPWYLVVAITVILVGTATLPARSLLFVMGTAVYRAGLLEEGARHRAINMGLVVLAAGVIGLSDISIAAVGVVTAALIFAGRSFKAPPALHLPLMILGGMSYSLYLVHVPIGGRIVNLGRRFVEGAGAELLLSTFALMCCLVFSYLFFSLIERPFRTIARTCIDGQRSAGH